MQKALITLSVAIIAALPSSALAHGGHIHAGNVDSRLTDTYKTPTDGSLAIWGDNLVELIVSDQGAFQVYIYSKDADAETKMVTALSAQTTVDTAYVDLRAKQNNRPVRENVGLSHVTDPAAKPESDERTTFLPLLSGQAQTVTEFTDFRVILRLKATGAKRYENIRFTFKAEAHHD